MITFVGAGSGAEDLITVRGARLLQEADVIVYAGSLVNPALLDQKKPGCEVYNSARMTLEEVLDVLIRSERAGKNVVRLHTGDPCLYGAIREQMDALKRSIFPMKSVRGSVPFCGAAAALEAEYTLPGVYPVGRDHTNGWKNAGTGERKHPEFCGASGDDGFIFEYRAARKTSGRIKGGRICAGDAGGDRI